MTFSGRPFPTFTAGDLPLDDGPFEEVRMIAERPMKLPPGDRMRFHIEWGAPDAEGSYRPVISMRVRTR